MDLPRSLHHTHKDWQNNVRSLRRVVSRERNVVSKNNLIIHFFMCAIRIEYENEYSDFKNIAEKIIRAATEVPMLDPRVSAASAVKKVLSVESFPSNMLSRVSIEDIRNAVVCELWKSHNAVVQSELGDVPQGIPQHVIGKMNTVQTTADDNVLLLNLLKWLNLAKRVVCVRGVVLEGTRMTDDAELDTGTGVWWKNIMTRGMTRVVWDMALDIAQYSSDNVLDESL